MEGVRNNIVVGGSMGVPAFSEASCTTDFRKNNHDLTCGRIFPPYVILSDKHTLICKITHNWLKISAQQMNIK